MNNFNAPALTKEQLEKAMGFIEKAKQLQVNILEQPKEIHQSHLNPYQIENQF